MSKPVGFGREEEAEDPPKRFNVGVKTYHSYSLGLTLMLWDDRPHRPIGFYFDFWRWTISVSMLLHPSRCE